MQSGRWLVVNIWFSMKKNEGDTNELTTRKKRFQRECKESEMLVLMDDIRVQDERNIYAKLFL